MLPTVGAHTAACSAIDMQRAYFRIQRIQSDACSGARGSCLCIKLSAAALVTTMPMGCTSGTSTSDGSCIVCNCGGQRASYLATTPQAGPACGVPDAATADSTACTEILCSNWPFFSRFDSSDVKDEVFKCASLTWCYVSCCDAWRCHMRG